MPFKLPDLPYAADALEPHMSRETFAYHHGKHHATYVEKLNKAIAGTPREGWELERVVHDAADKGDREVFNNAAQHWNHSFFWLSLSPEGGGRPDGELRRQIDRDFGSFETFAEAFSETAAGEFGSGWAWLVLEAGKLKVLSTSDADTPMVHGQQPLLTLDVWEHAYYIDHRNERPAYIRSFLDEMANWEFAAANFANQGEGNQAGARRYDEAQESFAKGGKVKDGAEEARRALDAGELEGARRAAQPRR